MPNLRSRLPLSLRLGWRRARRAARHSKLLLLSLLFILVVAPEWPAFQAEEYRLHTIVGRRGFDFLVWEVNALAVKGAALVSGSHNYLDGETEKGLVLEFLDLIGEAGRLQAEITRIFADPDVADPEAAAAATTEELARVRARIEAIKPLAEAIIEAQVAAVLVDEGFGIMGEAWPPVQMHMTPLPSVLVVSPRDRIEQIYGIPLQHGLSADARDTLEEDVYQDINLSALVVPIAGIGIYPAMIVERSDINRVMEVVAHEWAHHWLTLQPLGINYAASPELRVINETTASIFGNEVGRLVVARFYPELLPPPPQPPPDGGATDDEPPAFDFFAELGKTRVEADRLLAEGQVDEAEAYMEARRQFLWENGFQIRKLNQAFFAFYGAYADEPGAPGADPIGPTIVAIRGVTPSLRAFMNQMAPITSLSELQSRSPD